MRPIAWLCRPATRLHPDGYPRIIHGHEWLAALLALALLIRLTTVGLSAVIPWSIWMAISGSGYASVEVGQ